MITVEVSVKDNILQAFIKDMPDKCVVEEFKIKRYGSTVAVRKTDKNMLEYELNTEGVYVVMAVMVYDSKRITRFSWPVAYFTDKTREEFKSFLENEDSRYILEELPLYNMKYPFSYVATVYSKTSEKLENRLSDISRNLIVEHREQGGKSLYFLSNSGLQHGQLLFSGMAKYRERFIFGVNDFYAGEEYGELKESIGNFSAMYIRKDSVEIFNDFFGESKIYYFENDKYFVACNQYHLLLLILRQLEVTLKINYDLVKATLSCNHYMIAQQVFTSKALIDGIQFLEPYEYIRISDRVEVLDSPFKKYVEIVPWKISEDEKRKILEDAKKEIVENIRIVLENNKIDKTVIDITGGLDSRMVFTALSNIKDFDKNVKVRTLNIAEDLNIAAGIVNAYNLSVDDTPAYTPDFDTVLAEKQSCFLGASYKTYPIRNEMYYEEGQTLLRLGGGYGEPMTRHYLTHGIENEPLIDDKLFIHEFLRYISSDSVSYIADYPSGVQYIEKFWSEEVNKHPCFNNKEKTEFQFLTFRTAFHFKQFTVVGNVWMPLQSKNLYLLYRLTPKEEEFCKLALQVVAYFNTPIGFYEYGNAEYNHTLEKVKDELFLPEEKYRKFKPIFDKSHVQYDKIAVSRQSKSKNIPNVLKSGQQSEDKYKNFTETIYQETLTMLLVLAEHREMYEIAFQIWSYINLNKSNRERYLIWIWTRLKAILYQFEFTEVG